MTQSSSITVLDAAMGKALAMQGVEIPGTIWSANALLVAPDTVRQIHADNIAAGANMITTNSYGIIRSDLAGVGIEDQFAGLNRLAGELAQQAVADSGRDVRIAGSLPPLNGSFRPDRVLDRAIIEPLYREQAQELAPYVDLFLCETMSSIDEACAAATAALSLDKPVLVALTLDDERSLCLRSGESLANAITALKALEANGRGLEGILLNCSLPERITEAMPLLASAELALCGAYANAFSGVPENWLLDGDKDTDGYIALREDLDPARYARFAARWLKDGASLIGGCCGTTAQYTQALTDMLEQG